MKSKQKSQTLNQEDVKFDLKLKKNEQIRTEIIKKSTNDPVKMDSSKLKKKQNNKKEGFVEAKTVKENKTNCIVI